MHRKPDGHTPDGHTTGSHTIGSHTIGSHTTAGWLIAALLALALAVPSLAQTSESIRSLDQEIPVGDASSIHLKLRFGDLTITGSKAQTAIAEVRIRCVSGESDRCVAAAREIGLAWDRDGSVLRLKVTGSSRFASRHLAVSAALSLPAAMPLEVDLGAGDIDISGITGDVEIDVGAGDVKAMLAKSAFRAVKIDVNAGDAKLMTGGDTISGAGFVHKALSFKGGEGSSVLEIDIGAGDACVELE